MPSQKSLTVSLTQARVYQLKISLKYSEPLIWRRVQVPADITLGDLHHVIQTVMGWEDDHMHEFTIKKVNYGSLISDNMWGGWGLRIFAPPGMWRPKPGLQRL